MTGLEKRCQWLVLSQKINCKGLAKDCGYCIKHRLKTRPSPCIGCGRGTKTA